MQVSILADEPKGPVIQKVNSTTRTVIFKLPQKCLKTNDSRGIDIAKDKK